MATEYLIFTFIAPPEDVVEGELHKIWSDIISKAYDKQEAMYICSRGARFEELMLHLSCLYNKPALLFLGATWGLSHFTHMLKIADRVSPEDFMVFLKENLRRMGSKVPITEEYLQSLVEQRMQEQVEYIERHHRFMNTVYVKRFVSDPEIYATLQKEITSFEQILASCEGDYARYFDSQACLRLASEISDLLEEIYASPAFYTEIAGQVGSGISGKIANDILDIISGNLKVTSVKIGEMGCDSQQSHEYLTLEFLMEFRKLLLMAHDQNSGVVFYQQF